MKVNLTDILNVRELIQDDLICILEDSITEQMLNNVCQCVVDRMNNLTKPFE